MDKYVNREGVYKVIAENNKSDQMTLKCYDALLEGVSELPTRVERDLISEDDVTVYGYTIRELTAVARTCRLMGMQPEEIRGFLGNLDFAMECLKKDQEQAVRNAMKNIFGPQNSIDGVEFADIGPVEDDDGT